MSMNDAIEIENGTQNPHYTLNAEYRNETQSSPRMSLYKTDLFVSLFGVTGIFLTDTCVKHCNVICHGSPI